MIYLNSESCIFPATSKNGFNGSLVEVIESSKTLLDNNQILLIPTDDDDDDDIYMIAE